MFMRKYFHYNESLFEDVFSKLKACAAPKKWQRSRVKDSPETIFSATAQYQRMEIVQLVQW